MWRDPFLKIKLTTMAVYHLNNEVLWSCSHACDLPRAVPLGIGLMRTAIDSHCTLCLIHCLTAHLSEACLGTDSNVGFFRVIGGLLRSQVCFEQNEISVGRKQSLLSKSLSGESLLVLYIHVRIPPSIQCPPLDIQTCIGTRLLYLKPLHPSPKILCVYS